MSVWKHFQAFAISREGINFCDFLFVSQKNKPLPKGIAQTNDFVPKGSNSFLWKSWHLLRRHEKWKMAGSLPQKVYSFNITIYNWICFKVDSSYSFFDSTAYFVLKTCMNKRLEALSHDAEGNGCDWIFRKNSTLTFASKMLCRRQV